MKFEQLFYLQEAVKYKSISLAAEKNYISQSTFSASLAKLESEVGIPLLHRTRLGVTPTKMGEIVLEKSKTILAARDEIFAETSELIKGGAVSISCIACFSDWIVPKVLNRLRAEELPIALSVGTAESKIIASNVASGLSKFGVLIHYDALSANPDLDYTPLFKDNFGLYVGQNSPLWDKESISIEDVYSQPYIAYREEFLKDNKGLTAVVDVGERLNIIFRTDDLDALKRMIAQDDYVAFFPHFMTRNDYYLASGLIRNIPIHDYPADFEVGYVSSKRFKPSSIEKKVLDILQGILKDEAFHEEK